MNRQEEKSQGMVIKEMTKGYDRGKVLNQLSFSLPIGETLVVTGPSGCGKTTLLRLIAGLEVPDSGEIHMGNRVVSSRGWAAEPHTRGMGFVFQSPALWPHMTVRENILFGLHSVTKPEAEERVTQLLAAVSMSHLAQRYPDQLSGGEAKRVAIVRTLAPKPKFVLMDEPLTHLNVELKDQLLAFILQMVKESQASLLYVTHDEEEAKCIGGKGLHLKSAAHD